MTARRRNAKISARGASELARWRKGDSELLLRSDGAILSKAFKGEPWKLWARTKTGDVARVDAALSKQGYVRANPFLPPPFIPPNPLTAAEQRELLGKARWAKRSHADVERMFPGESGAWRDVGYLEALEEAAKIGGARPMVAGAIASSARDAWRATAASKNRSEVRRRVEEGRWRPLGRLSTGDDIYARGPRLLIVEWPDGTNSRLHEYASAMDLRPAYRAEVRAMRRAARPRPAANPLSPARRNPLLLAVGNPSVHFTDPGHYMDPSTGYVRGTPKSVEILSPKPFRVTLTTPAGRQAKPRLARGVFAKDLDNPPARKRPKRPSRARYERRRVADPRLFDPRSFRVKDPGRPGHTKLVVGCPKGHWSARRRRCKVGTRTQAVLRERRNPAGGGRTMNEAQARAWARAHGLERELDRAIRLQTVANRRPTAFRIARIPMGDAKKVQMRAVLAHYGTSPEDVYMPPRGSKKGSVMYRHEWGEGNRRAAGRPGVAVLAAPSGKALIKLMGPGQRVDSWMRG